MDDRLRALERARGDSPEAEAAWLAARLRAGTIDVELLRVAALAGHAAAALALEGGLERMFGHPDEELASALHERPPAVRAYVAAAVGRALLPRIAAPEARAGCQAVVDALSAPTLDRAALLSSHQALSRVVVDEDEARAGHAPASEPTAVAATNLYSLVDGPEMSFTSLVAPLDDADEEASRVARAAAASALLELALGVTPTEAWTGPGPTIGSGA